MQWFKRCAVKIKCSWVPLTAELSARPVFYCIITGMFRMPYKRAIEECTYKMNEKPMMESCKDYR